MTKNKSIFIKNVYYMLSYAFSALNQGEFENIAKEDFDNIHNLFAAILSMGISKQLKQGLHREYVNKTENLTTVRGKIDMPRAIGNLLARRRAVTCEYDELSENNPLNRVIKTAALLLIKCPDVEEKYAVALKREMMFFGGIETVEPMKIHWQSVKCPRNNGACQMLIGICRLVLESMLPTTESGDYRLASFLKDLTMSRLYEKFILEFYRKECSELVSAEASQIDWALDDGSDGRMLPKMRSDITLTDKKTGGILIIDAKYYTREMQEYYDSQTIRSGHLYQIFAYVKNRAAATDCPSDVSGLLLYAKSEDSEPMDYEYTLSGNRIGARTLDLNREFEEIRSELRAIAEAIGR